MPQVYLIKLQLIFYTIIYKQKYNNFNNPKMSSIKQQGGLFLSETLAHISQRYCTLFFTKILLYNDITRLQESSISHIRHYDLQCEAVQAINGVLKTAIQRKTLQALIILKHHGKKRFRRTASKSVCETPQSRLKLKEQEDIISEVRVMRKGSVDFERQRYFGKSRGTVKYAGPEITYNSQKTSSASEQITQLFQQVKMLARNQLQVEYRNREEGRKKQKILDTISQLQVDITEWVNKKMQENTPKKEWRTETTNKTVHTRKTVHNNERESRKEANITAVRKYRPSLREKRHQNTFFEEM